MDYSTLEFVANCLEAIHDTKDSQHRTARLYRMDQKKLIRRVLGNLLDQMLHGISQEGDHAGWRVQKNFLSALYARRYETAYQLLPALGIETTMPFLADCPEAERILPSE